MSEKSKELNQIEEELKKLQASHDYIKERIKHKTQSSYRKERAKRLIETGALAEKYFELDGLSLEQREKLFKTFSQFIVANKPNEFKKTVNPE